jgi:hypothetical protein
MWENNKVGFHSNYCPRHIGWDLVVAVPHSTRAQQGIFWWDLMAL